MDFPSIFSKSKEWDWVFLLSYDLYPISFFETEIINKIQVNNNITVAIDYYNYRNLISNSEVVSNYMGIYYNLEPIKVKNGGRFHPKFYLLLSSEKAEIYMGSANLTQSGFKKNYECLLSFSFDLNDLDNSDIDFLIQIRKFLKDSFINSNNLIEKPNTLIRKTATDILESTFFTSIEKLHRDVSDEFDRKYHFLFSTENSLLSQVEETINEDIDKLYVLSPFFDQDVAILQDIGKKYRSIDIYVPQKNSTFPATIFKTHQNDMKNISVYTAEKKDIEPRFIHAKLYRFIANKRKFDFITSGNFSKAGIYNDNYPRNFEIGLLLPGEGEFLYHADLNTQQVSDFDEIITDDIENPVQSSCGMPFDIESAYYSRGKITITLNSDFLNSACIAEYVISLLLDGIEENRYVISSDNDKYFFEPSLEIEGNQSIRLQLFSKDPEYRSVAITVSREKHDPNFLPMLGSSAFTECVKTGGVAGLEKAFKFAKASGKEDWLIYLLSHWNLEKILYGIDEETNGGTDENDFVPRLPPEKRTKIRKKRIQKNLSTILSSINMRENISSFLDSLKNANYSFEEYIEKYIKYSFPFFFEINLYFKLIIAREENKKERNPSINYPEYSWLHNYKELYSYVFLIFKDLKKNVLIEDLDRISDNIKFRLIVNIILWIHLNTKKTIEKFKSDKYFIQFESNVYNTLSKVRKNFDVEVIDEVTTLFNKSEVPINIIM